MKQCPICQAIAFDDAATCFGCLHEFNLDVEQEAAGCTEVPETESHTEVGPPSFLIRIRPEREGSGQVSWTCTVDLIST